MNRVIFVFIFIFVTIFAGAYMLMQQAIRPAPVPSPASKAEVAKSDDSAAKDEKGESTKATVASDTKIRQEESPSRSSTSDDNAPPTTKQVQKDSNKPKPVDRSARTLSQRKQKQFMSSIPAATPKPREVNGGIWDEDLDRLQGTWRMVDVEYDGERIPDEAKKYSWEFRVDEYRIKNNDNFMELWVIEVNSSRRPKTIDSRGTLTSVGPTSGRKLMGIYEVTDDELKVCYDLTGNGRPDSFKAAKGSRRACYYFKR
jgi:uncharacterized protein (TIGR03067 family)